jgi:hypothetical protein
MPKKPSPRCLMSDETFAFLHQILKAMHEGSEMVNVRLTMSALELCQVSAERPAQCMATLQVPREMLSQKSRFPASGDASVSVWTRSLLDAMAAQRKSQGVKGMMWTSDGALRCVTYRNASSLSAVDYDEAVPGNEDHADYYRIYDNPRPEHLDWSCQVRLLPLEFATQVLDVVTAQSYCHFSLAPGRYLFGTVSDMGDVNYEWTCRDGDEGGDDSCAIVRAPDSEVRNHYVAKYLKVVSGVSESMESLRLYWSRGSTLVAESVLACGKHRCRYSVCLRSRSQD